MKVDEIIQQGRDAIGVRRVYGEPYEKNGVTLIAAARVMGGAGGGDGTVPAVEGEEHGSVRGGQGAGFGMVANPAGAFVIKGDSVRWMPAVDVNRLMFGFQIVTIIGLLVLRSMVKARAKAKVEAAKAAR